ncbi:InlB B-repeat-containing protein [Spirochaeta lutea]|uniref:Bacterial repeat domain-containing protein n=1 Tax=Spirochaeta lutea TaxID=1480694 RepID=A0A098QWY7_9SPIO|nr:hypothetical protein [Spirochaeta lutea]KGE72091.1 hypothetical protein DC28_08305 [Spirochaeta lutea]
MKLDTYKAWVVGTFLIFLIAGCEAILPPEVIDTETVLLVISTNPENGGIIDGLQQDGMYSKGDVASIKAIPSEGFVFTGWTGDYEGDNNPASISMDANKSVIAAFSSIDEAVVVNEVSGGTVTYGLSNLFSVNFFKSRAIIRLG